MTPSEAAADSIDAPTPESIGSSSSTVAPWVMSDSAWACSVASLPWALVMMNWLRLSPAVCSARARYGASNSVYRGEVVVSGSSTPILPLPRAASPRSLRITEKSVVNEPRPDDRGITCPRAPRTGRHGLAAPAASPAAGPVASSTQAARQGRASRARPGHGEPGHGEPGHGGGIRVAVTRWRTGSRTAAR